MLKQHINIFVILRILIGLLLVFSSTEKLLSHYQNFLYVIQSYEILPSSLERLTAIVFPWIELLTGLFLILGLWLPLTLKVTTVLFTIFIAILTQALIRKLPITECGCFGQAVSFPPQVTLVLDSVTFMFIVWLNVKIQKVRQFSLDQYFSH